jgi:hypothetical protein
MSDTLDRAAKLPPTSYTYEVRQVAAPAAGTDFLIPVPSGEVWRLHAVRAQLAASAVVANRVPHLTIDDQSSISAQYVAGSPTVANGTTVYNWIAGFPVVLAAIESGLLDVPIVEHVLQMGWRIRPITAGLDAGDQWSAITVTLERLNTPPESIAHRYVRITDTMRDIADTLEAEGY